MTDLMKKYKVTFTYEEEVEAINSWEALITVGSDERILEHLGSDATVEEITQ